MLIDIEHGSSGKLECNDSVVPCEFSFLPLPSFWDPGWGGCREWNSLISVSACCGTVIVFLE